MFMPIQLEVFTIAHILGSLLHLRGSVKGSCQHTQCEVSFYHAPVRLWCSSIQISLESYRSLTANSSIDIGHLIAAVFGMNFC